MIYNYNPEILLLEVCPIVIICGPKMMCLKMCIIALFEMKKIGDWVNGQWKIKELVFNFFNKGEDQK